MTVLAYSQAAPAYVRSMDYASSPTATALRGWITGTSVGTSPSWSDGREERQENALVLAATSAKRKGVPVNSAALQVAVTILELLPTHVPLPTTINVGEDGYVDLDWDLASNKVLSLSAAPNGSVGYSALRGLEPVYGRAPLAGALPMTVVNLLNDFFPSKKLLALP